MREYLNIMLGTQHLRPAALKILARRGLTETEYRILFDSHEGMCALCWRREDQTVGDLIVDRPDENGIYGLLCSDCLGTVRKFLDNPEWFERAARYLRRQPIIRDPELRPPKKRIGSKDVLYALAGCWCYVVKPSDRRWVPPRSVEVAPAHPAIPVGEYGTKTYHCRKCHQEASREAKDAHESQCWS